MGRLGMALMEGAFRMARSVDFVRRSGFWVAFACLPLCSGCFTLIGLLTPPQFVGTEAKYTAMSENLKGTTLEDAKAESVRASFVAAELKNFIPPGGHAIVCNSIILSDLRVYFSGGTDKAEVYFDILNASEHDVRVDFARTTLSLSKNDQRPNLARLCDVREVLPGETSNDLPTVGPEITDGTVAAKSCRRCRAAFGHGMRRAEKALLDVVLVDISSGEEFVYRIEYHVTPMAVCLG